jgi:hypothetical protein
MSQLPKMSEAPDEPPEKQGWLTVDNDYAVSSAKQTLAAMLILSIVLTIPAFGFFCSLFFFFGFFNPVLFISTTPLLYLIRVVQTGKKKYVVWGWAAISVVLVIIGSIISFGMGWHKVY